MRGDTLCLHVQSHEIGDTLIYTVDSSGKIKKEIRAYLPEAQPDYDAQTLISPGNGRLYVYLPDRGELIGSQQPYHRFVDTVSFDSVRRIQPTGYLDQNWHHFHVDERDVWYLLGSPYPWINSRNASSQNSRPRLLAVSEDKGQSWQVDTIDTAWPLKFERPPQLSVHYTHDKRIIQLSSAYKMGDGPWEIPGDQYREPGLMPYDGANLIDPIRPNIAYHATNKGIAVSYHYGDSLRVENTGVRSPAIRDLVIDEESREGYTAGVTGLHRIWEYDQPWEAWKGPRVIRPFDFVTAVDFSRQRPDLVYAGWKRLYRSKAGGKEGSWVKMLDPLKNDSNRYRGLRSLEKIYVSPLDSQLVLAHFSASHDFIMVSYDGGLSWAEAYYDPGFLGIDAWTVLYQNGVHYLVTVHNGTSPMLRSRPVAPFGSLGPGTEEVLEMDWPFDVSPYFYQMQTAENENAIFMVGSSSLAAVTVPVVLKKGPNGIWDMVKGPQQPNCTGCYTAAEAITLTGDSIFVGMGHKLFRAPRHLGDSLRPVFRYPTFTRIIELAAVDDKLLVATEAGVFEHRLLSLSDNSDNGQVLNVFPNPTRAELHFYPPARVQFFDLGGRRVYKSTQPETTVNLNAFSAGLYHLVHPLGSRKIIKR